MPKRTDLQTILIIGSGPIVIGQGCEFDYSGAQACKALRREGYRVVLINSNPATIMTDPDFADATYIEPLTPEVVRMVIAQERPDALLPTMGGQTALNLAMALHKDGTLAAYGVELIGATAESIELAEDRQRFRDAMVEIGMKMPASQTVTDVEQALQVAEQIGYPILVRASFTLGGTGGGIARNPDELRRLAAHGLNESPIHQILIDQSVLGWKEYELEIMRDKHDNFVVVCGIENLDPMGVHTGDSITVAPIQTLTDRELQRLRDMAKRIIQRVGLETGGANIQFAVNPTNGETVVIEMNPRVSRSSALASKATGFPIAKIAALVAVGYTLDEIQNDITRKTKASFEPSLDYVVVKIPRWNFEKFRGTDPTLGPQMKAIGEVMAIGRTFPEALQKAIASLDIGLFGFGDKADDPQYDVPIEQIAIPTAQRLHQVAALLRRGVAEPEICRLTGYDAWFVRQLSLLAEQANAIRAQYERGERHWKRWKQLGFTDRYLAKLLGTTETAVRAERKAAGAVAHFYRVDTCAAEFEAYTPYLYSTYERDCEAMPTERPKIVILGGGPNRIGQGIEFDYCCVHACYALSALGYETIMINNNPETVSTDYDTADRLYFEPLTFEHVLNVVETERPQGVLVQFGGQTPLNIARQLADAGVPILGTPIEAIETAEDRERFNQFMRQLDIPQPEGQIARSPEALFKAAEQIGYPVLVRPSYVLGGRGMAICFNREQIASVLETGDIAWDGQAVLIDQFLDDAFEVDVDALCDGERVTIGGIMQHIEEAGIHSGDSACVLPPYKISYYYLDQIREYTERIGLALGVRGLFNIQFAIKNDVVYVLEVNPRASRTTPFVSKATGVPLARYAAEIAVGRSLREIGFTQEPKVDGFFVKEAVLPFRKLLDSEARLGPEMRSTGEVMGHASSFGHAFAKSQSAADMALPLSGRVLITVNDFDKSAAAKIARDLHKLGFELIATAGTARFLRNVGLPVTTIAKVSEGSTAILDALRDGAIQLVINTSLGGQAHDDGRFIRNAAAKYRVPIVTTLSAAQAAVQGIQALRKKPLRVRSLQAHYSATKA
ncbi:MAG: carbamoyl phosphate synthase large subunit [Candidatus Thermofonsia Clade 1 bacterium]|uniref:Carbamoyl phosphate synthase large chain n=1 Tax=Candidatus Thermofonsia Clade 1 bacterium TaxID=2364210 RepID=A0A2M8PHE6_9CHLR|nr:MAG: carbamoyl phosphate synthase large subunit [Candidatus Thermofonsia Clade 1 bacterium]